MDGGHAVAHSHGVKVRKYEERCNAEGMEFVPLAVNTFGGWHKVALQTLAKLGRQLERVLWVGPRMILSGTSGSRWGRFWYVTIHRCS